MTMLSFRVGAGDALAATEWAERLGVDRSAFLRDALRLHLARVCGEHDAATWENVPLDEGERSLEQINDWGPAEDWSDWSTSDESGQ